MRDGHGAVWVPFLPLRARFVPTQSRFVTFRAFLLTGRLLLPPWEGSYRPQEPPHMCRSRKASAPPFVGLRRGCALRPDMAPKCLRQLGACFSSKRIATLLVVAAAVLTGVPSAVGAVTTYTAPYAGGTIAPSDTVLLNNGATVTGNVTDNGT